MNYKRKKEETCERTTKIKRITLQIILNPHFYYPDLVGIKHILNFMFYIL